MNKRGQIFILIALVLILFIYLATLTYNSYNETIALEDFEGLSDNYESEANKVVNKVIYEGGDAEEQAEAIKGFSEEYKDFANEVDPNFGMVYIYTDTEGNVHIQNLLNNEEIKISYGDDKYGTEDTKIIFSSDQTTENEICIDDICMKVETEISAFGEGYYNNILENAKTLQIQLGNKPPIEVPLSGFKSIEKSEKKESNCQKDENGDCLEEYGTIKITYPAPA